MVLAGVDFWYDNYGLWPWQAKPRPKTKIMIIIITVLIIIIIIKREAVGLLYMEFPAIYNSSKYIFLRFCFPEIGTMPGIHLVQTRTNKQTILSNSELRIRGSIENISKMFFFLIS